MKYNKMDYYEIKTIFCALNLLFVLSNDFYHALVFSRWQDSMGFFPLGFQSKFFNHLQYEHIQHSNVPKHGNLLLDFNYR